VSHTLPVYGDLTYQLSSSDRRPNPRIVSNTVLRGPSGLQSYRNRTALFVFFGKLTHLCLYAPSDDIKWAIKPRRHVVGLLNATINSEEAMQTNCSNHIATTAPVVDSLLKEYKFMVWNSLPTSVKFASLSGLKSLLSRVDFTQFLKCHWFFYCDDCTWKLSCGVLVYC